MATRGNNGLGRMLAVVMVAAAALSSGATLVNAAGPQPAQNGEGPDPDGDGNPATNVFSALVRTGAAQEAADAPFRVVTFETLPPREARRPIRTQFSKDFGVSFGEGLTLQACMGRRYFEFDTRCTYLAPPSGRYAARYADAFGRPLEIAFDAPVCAIAAAIYPTGGREGERFTASIDLYDGPDAKKVGAAKVQFDWTRDTFRWRSKMIAMLEDRSATRAEVSLRGENGKPVEFLIDDLAFIVATQDGAPNACAAALSAYRDAAASQ